MRKGRGVVLISVALLVLAGFIVGEYEVIGRTERWILVLGTAVMVVVPILVEHLILNGIECWRRPSAVALRLEADAKRNAADALGAESTSRKAKASFDAYIMLRAREVTLANRVTEFSNQVWRLEQESKDIEKEAWRLSQDQRAIPEDVTEALDRLVKRSRIRVPDITRVPSGISFQGDLLDEAAGRLLKVGADAIDRFTNSRRRIAARDADNYEQRARESRTAKGSPSELPLVTDLDRQE